MQLNINFTQIFILNRGTKSKFSPELFGIMWKRLEEKGDEGKYTVDP